VKRLVGGAALLVAVAIGGAYLNPYIIYDAAAEAGKSYVGSKACASCHEEEYENFIKYSKKAHSFHSVQLMRKELTSSELKECFHCHTTGYGKPGGFISEKQTPDLKNLGCETCHGPGSAHVDSEDASDILGKVDKDSCKACHNTDRVRAFRYKPMLYAGAH